VDEMPDVNTRRRPSTVGDGRLGVVHCIRCDQPVPRCQLGRFQGLPNSDAWEVETTIAGSTLVATVLAPRGPVFRMWVVLDARDLGLAVPPPRQLDLPLLACIVEALAEQLFDPCVGWLRNLELALAWAWVRQEARLA
jgi:hypothetical protein